MRFFNKASLLVCLMACCTISCGGTDGGLSDDIPTNSYPVVSRVDPANGLPGDTVTIFGLGFSSTAPNNIVIMGGSAIAATAYNLVEPPIEGEVESLTVTVPENAVAGSSSVVVEVYENTSNADILFTVDTP